TALFGYTTLVFCKTWIFELWCITIGPAASKTDSANEKALVGALTTRQGRADNQPFNQELPTCPLSTKHRRLPTRGGVGEHAATPGAARSVLVFVRSCARTWRPWPGFLLPLSRTSNCVPVKPSPTPSRIRARSAQVVWWCGCCPPPPWWRTTPPCVCRSSTTVLSIPARCVCRLGVRRGGGSRTNPVGDCCSSTNWPVSGEPSAGPTRAPRGSPARCCGPNSPTPPLPQLPPSPMPPAVFVGVGDEHRHHLHGSAPGAGRTPGPTLQPHPTPPRASRGNTFIDVGNTRAAAT